jgi:hypothetical protein
MFKAIALPFCLIILLESFYYIVTIHLKQFVGVQFKKFFPIKNFKSEFPDLKPFNDLIALMTVNI